MKQKKSSKFNNKIFSLDQYHAHPQVFEEEEIESSEVNKEGEQNKGDFTQNDQYFVDCDDQYYISEKPEFYGNADYDIDEIYAMCDSDQI